MGDNCILTVLDSLFEKYLRPVRLLADCYFRKKSTYKEKMTTIQPTTILNIKYNNKSLSAKAIQHPN